MTSRRLPRAALSLLAMTLCAAADAPPGPARKAVTPPATPPSGPSSPRLPTSASCRPQHAWRCQADGCEAADEGLSAEQFVLDTASSTLGACLYTDCYAGRAQLSRDPGRPWVVAALGEVHSERPADGVPPPGSAPFPLTLTVDLRSGRFTATWSHGADGLQVDFGTCNLSGRP